MRDAVIVEAVRTPIGKGKPNGALAHVHPVELLAHTLRTLVERSGIDPALIDDVIGGTVDQVGEQAMNTTRYAVLSAGFPESVPATTVDRQCGSSQQAVHFAAQGVLFGRVRHRRGLRRGVDEPGAHVVERAAPARTPSGPASPSATRRASSRRASAPS